MTIPADLLDAIRPTDYLASAEAPPRYRYLLTDVMSGMVLSEGRGLIINSYSRRLSDAGDCTATLPVGDAFLRQVDNPVAATEPRRTALWIIRNELVVWGGIIWTRAYRSAESSYEITASAFESYLARRRIRATLTYTQVDQNQILWDLLGKAQAVAHGNIGIVQGAIPAPSGIKRDRTYAWHERATFLQRMQELSQVIDGPDFTFEPGWAASGAPQVSLRVGSPLGAPSAVSVLEFPPDIRNYTWTDDGGNSANFWSAIGDPLPGDDDGPPLIRDAQVSAEWGAGVPLLEDVSQHQGVTDPATLTGYAKANVAKAAGNRAIPEVTVRMVSTAQLPGLGDTTQLRITDPQRFPPDPATGAPGLIAQVRVTGWTVNLSAGEGETISLTLGEG